MLFDYKAVLCQDDAGVHSHDFNALNVDKVCLITHICSVLSKIRECRMIKAFYRCDGIV